MATKKAPVKKKAAAKKAPAKKKPVTIKKPQVPARKKNSLSGKNLGSINFSNGSEYFIDKMAMKKNDWFTVTGSGTAITHQGRIAVSDGDLLIHDGKNFNVFTNKIKAEEHFFFDKDVRDILGKRKTEIDNGEKKGDGIRDAIVKSNVLSIISDILNSQTDQLDTTRKQLENSLQVAAMPRSDGKAINTEDVEYDFPAGFFDTLKGTEGTLSDICHALQRFASLNMDTRRLADKLKLITG